MVVLVSFVDCSLVSVVVILLRFMVRCLCIVMG